MEEYWAYEINPLGQLGPNYWIYFAERLAHLATIPMSAMILDLGTYDGNVLFRAMEKMNAQGYGVGADIYYGGFHDGAAEVRQRRWDERVAFVQMDGDALGLLPETFHTVLANFVGFDDCFDFDRMEYTKPGWVISEIMRVLKPGGQMGFGGWIEQSDIDWIIAAFKNYLPEYENNFICYGKENPEGQKIILQSSGFENVHVHVERTEFVSPDTEIWWRQMKQAVSDYFKQVSDLDTLRDFKRQVFADLQPFQYPEGIRFSKTVSFAFGTKPNSISHPTPR